MAVRMATSRRSMAAMVAGPSLAIKFAALNQVVKGIAWGKAFGVGVYCVKPVPLEPVSADIAQISQCLRMRGWWNDQTTARQLEQQLLGRRCKFGEDCLGHTRPRHKKKTRLLHVCFAAEPWPKPRRVAGVLIGSLA